jgi:hypothetical protein
MQPVARAATLAVTLTRFNDASRGPPLVAARSCS